MSELDDEGLEGVEIRDLETIALFVFFSTLCLGSLTHICSDQVMQINADALLYVVIITTIPEPDLKQTNICSSLQIFDNESHASVHSDRTKEGLSLFG